MSTSFIGGERLGQLMLRQRDLTKVDGPRGLGARWHDTRVTARAASVPMPLFFDANGLATTLTAPDLVPVDRDLRTLMLANSVASNTIIRPEANLARQILAIVEGRTERVEALPMPTSSAARDIAETLRANPGDVRSLDALAASVHTSTRSIERAFHAETGMMLRRWRIRTRMEAAARLVRTEARLDAVAHRVGYTNVSAFRRVFLAHFGATPGEYRRRYAFR